MYNEVKEVTVRSRRVLTAVYVVLLATMSGCFGPPFSRTAYDDIREMGDAKRITTWALSRSRDYDVLQAQCALLDIVGSGSEAERSAAYDGYLAIHQRKLEGWPGWIGKSLSASISDDYYNAATWIRGFPHSIELPSLLQAMKPREASSEMKEWQEAVANSQKSGQPH